MNCVIQKDISKSSLAVSMNVVLYGNKVFTDAMELKVTLD
jgi:hypothetical protein